MPADGFRFVLTVNGVSKRLVTARLSRNGDVNIAYKPGPFLRSETLDEGCLFEPNLSGKITIHTSKKSDDGNQITFEQFIKGERKKRSQKFTKAVKRDNCFSLIYARLYHDLKGSGVLIDDDDSMETVSLGDYDPDNFCLIFALCIGRSIREFNLDPLKTSIFSRNVGFFKIIALVSYFNLPASAHGDIWMPTTQKSDEKELPAIEFESLLRGLDEKEIIQDFSEICFHLQYGYMKRLFGMHVPNSLQRRFGEIAGLEVRMQKDGAMLPPNLSTEYTEMADFIRRDYAEKYSIDQK